MIFLKSYEYSNDKYFSKIFARFFEIQYAHNAVLIRNIIMNILNFMQRFLDEASCIACLKEQREQSGIVCKYCVSVRNIVGMQQVCFRVKALSSQAAITLRNSYETQQAAFPLLDSSHVPANKRQEILFNRGNPSLIRLQMLSAHLRDGLQAS